MTHALVHAALWLQQAAPRDTVYTMQVAANPTTFERIAGIANGLMSIALLALAIAAIPALWNFRKSYKRVNRLLERIYGDVNPIMRHASAIADNIDYITTSVRTDVQQINATIASANRRLHEAVALTEDRLREFNALLEVVQQEAEQVFVSTASAVRGVRRGAEALRGRAAGGPDLALEEEEDGLDYDEAELLDDMEEMHGDERDTSEAPDVGGPARPRVRRRGRRDVRS
jgi:uncharacterized protein YoxC